MPVHGRTEDAEALPEAAKGEMKLLAQTVAAFRAQADWLLAEADRPSARPPIHEAPARPLPAGQPAGGHFLFDIWPFMYFRCRRQSYYECLLAISYGFYYQNSSNRAFRAHMPVH